MKKTVSTIHLVKRKGHIEPFDVKKVYASVYWAARSAHIFEQEAEKMAEQVSKNAVNWIQSKTNVSSDDIFQFVGVELAKLNHEAAYMYRTHRDIS